MTTGGVDLILAALADLRNDLKRLETVQDMVLHEARRTNGRVTDLESWQTTTLAVADEREKRSVAVKSNRRKWVERFATLASGGALTVLGWYLQTKG